MAAVVARERVLGVLPRRSPVVGELSEQLPGFGIVGEQIKQSLHGGNNPGFVGRPAFLVVFRFAGVTDEWAQLLPDNEIACRVRGSLSKLPCSHEGRNVPGHDATCALIDDHLERLHRSWSGESGLTEDADQLVLDPALSWRVQSGEENHARRLATGLNGLHRYLRDTGATNPGMTKGQMGRSPV